MKSTISKFFAAPFETPLVLQNPIINSLDGLRAISIGIVILGHFRLTKNLPHSIYNFLNTIFGGGELGVRFFFVISGFLITVLLIKEKQKTGTIHLRKFYIRRILRIFPVFYAYLIFLFIVDSFLHLGINKLCYVGAALYLSNFTILPSSWATGHSWSLAVEEQYYLLWPLLFRARENLAIISALGVFLLAPFIRVFVYLHPEYFNISLAPFITNADAIFLGSLIAIVAYKGYMPWDFFRKYKLVIHSVGIPVIFFIYHCLHTGKLGLFMLPIGTSLTSLIVGAIIISNVQDSGDYIFAFLNNKYIMFIGKLSYSLYIWQQLFLIPLSAKYNNVFWNFFPLNLILTITAGLLSYFFLESFFLRIKKRFKIV